MKTKESRLDSLVMNPFFKNRLGNDFIIFRDCIEESSKSLVYFLRDNNLDVNDVDRESLGKLIIYYFIGLIDKNQSLTDSPMYDKVKSNLYNYGYIYSVVFSNPLEGIKYRDYKEEVFDAAIDYLKSHGLYY